MTHIKSGWLYLIVILAEIALVGILFVFPALNKNFMVLETIMFAMMIFPFFIFMLATGTGFKDFFGFHKVRFSTIMWTLLYVILITPMSNFLNRVTALIFGNVAENVLSSNVSEYPFIITFLVIAVMGPILEEMMFRGVFYRNFRKSGRLLSSVIVSAIIFGLYHRNLNQFFYTTYVGVMFSLIDEAADSIWPSVISHIIFNGYSVCLVYLLKGQIVDVAMTGTPLANYNEIITDLENSSELITAAATAVALVILAVIGLIFIFLAWLVVRKIAKNERNLSLVDKKIRVNDYLIGNKKIFSIPLIIGIVIASASTIYSSVILFT